MQLLKTDFFLRGNQCKEIKVGVRRKNVLVPEIKQAALTKKGNKSNLI